MLTPGPLASLAQAAAESFAGTADAPFDDSTHAWLMSTLDRLPEGLLVTTVTADLRDARIIFANESLCRLTGYRRHELMGQSPWILHGPDVDEEQLELLRTTVLANREFRGELRRSRHDGTHFVADWSVSPILSADGRITHCVAVERDLSAERRAAEALRQINDDLARSVSQRTSALADLAQQLSAAGAERSRSEEALGRSEQRFRLLCEQLPVGVFLADASGACCYANPRLQAINEATDTELFGDGYVRRIHHSDREAVVRQWREDTENNRESLACFRIVPPSGRIRWAQARAIAVRSATGELIGYVGTLKDITDERSAEEALQRAHAQLEQRVAERTRELSQANDELAAEIRERRVAEQSLLESEARWRALVENAPAYILLTDTEGTIQFLNRARPGMDIDLLVGHSLYDRIPDDSQALVRERLQHCMASGEPTEFDATGFDANDEIVWYHTRVAPVGQGDQATGCLFVSTDITDRRRAEEEARKRQAELAHVARISTVTELATGLAHEINQPLTAIVSSAEAMLRFVRNGETLSAPDATQVIEHIAEQAQRAAAIVRHLRGFVRKATPSRTAADINQLIDDTVTFMRHEARRSNVGIETELADNLPPLMIDSVQIQQVFVNLIKNACESSRDAAGNEPLVVVRSQLCGESDVEVSVEDRGAGIDPEIAEQVFDTFFTTKSTGLGLGLSISRSLVEDHGGRLWMTPNPDRGVTFHCRLPFLGPNYDGARTVRIPG